MLRPSTLEWLQGTWARGGPAHWVLNGLAWLYGAAVAVRQWLYRTGLKKTHRLPVPVIVVGNVVAGGAGKTPTLILLVQHLKAKGWAVGVVSKGYGRRSDRCLEVQQDSSATDVGDEPLLIARRCRVPVVVAQQRVLAARTLLARHPTIQVLVADDGLQHLALDRDLNIVVWDERGVGNGRLLPAGWLREPWPLRSAANPVMCLQTAPTTQPAPGPHPWIARRQLSDQLINGKGERKSLQSFVAQPVMALAGIAKPEAFFSMLRTQGLTIQQAIALADHFDFSEWQIPFVTQDGQALEVICTEKDAVKLWGRYPTVWAAPLELQPEAGFFDALDRHLGTPSAPPALTR